MKRSTPGCASKGGYVNSRAWAGASASMPVGGGSGSPRGGARGAGAGPAALRAAASAAPRAAASARSFTSIEPAPSLACLSLSVPGVREPGCVVPGRFDGVECGSRASSSSSVLLSSTACQAQANSLRASWVRQETFLRPATYITMRWPFVKVASASWRLALRASCVRALLRARHAKPSQASTRRSELSI